MRQDYFDENPIFCRFLKLNKIYIIMKPVNASAPNQSPLPVLTVGLEPEIERSIQDLLRNTQVTSIPMEMDRILEPVLTQPCLVISGPPKDGLPAIELAQALRMQFQSTPLFICCVSQSGFERKSFIKNGFTDAFLMPMDTTILRTKLSEELARRSGGQIRVYRPVKILDVEPGVSLDFEVSLFLPANQKYVKVTNVGESLDAERIDRMKKGNFNNIQVPVEQMGKFYEYSAKRLKAIEKSSMSETEKREKFSGSVRDLISGLFSEQSASFESGQAILKDCGEIVKAFILQDADSEWFARIQQVLGERGDQYSHSANVSTLAALFSMGLGIGKPEDLALAGLFHDIGISSLPAEIQALEPSQMNPQQFEEYKKHPEISLNLVKKRKIVINETIMRAILQHHELYNGKGFPKGYAGDRISKEAQVLALADEFDSLTRLVEGHPLMTPIEAVEHLRKMQVNSPSSIHYSPELLNQLLTLFPAPKS